MVSRLTQSTMGAEGSTGELPNLRRLRNTCFVRMSVALVVFLTVSAITVVPRAELGMSRFLDVTLIVALYFFVIGLRALVIVHQLSHNRSQIFDRPTPGWITAAFLVCGVAVALWPRSV